MKSEIDCSPVLRCESEDWSGVEMEVVGEVVEKTIGLRCGKVVECDGVVGECVVGGKAKALVLEIADELVEEGGGGGVDGRHKD